MPWFKVDDKHHDHRKTRRALRGGQKRRDAAAIGLWSLAGSWSADNLMDGFVPTDELLRWDDDGESLAARLVEAEFWEPSERDGEQGFQFINWEEHQPTKADVEAKREAARERMRVARSKGGRGSGEVRANEQANNTRSSRDVRSTPSRPVPTRPDPKEETPRAVALVEADRFDEFWAAYDKRRGRKNAEAKYRLALKKPGVTADLLIAAAASYVEWQRQEGKHPQFTKDPATWLNGEHWTDERVARARPQTRVQEHLTLVQQLAAEEAAQPTLPQIGYSR